MLSKWLNFLKSFVFTSHKNLVATVDRKIQWVDHNDLIETITFYLFENQKTKKRSWAVHEYGLCKTLKMHKKYLGEILTWVYGGDFPQHTVELNQRSAKIIKFN